MAFFSLSEVERKTKQISKKKDMKLKDKNFFIEELVLAALRERCASYEQDTTLVSALKDVVEKCEKDLQVMLLFFFSTNLHSIATPPRLEGLSSSEV